MKPASPAGARWWIMCCTRAKLALPAGGAPNRQRLSSRSSSPRQSLTLKGGLARTLVGLEVRVAIVVAVGDLAVDAADGEVHLGQAPGVDSWP
jgi:hypothetical protein